MIVLGSGSIARKNILYSAGLEPGKVIVPNINESSKNNELPTEYVKRMALEKAVSIDVDPNDVLITADTIVVVGRNILHKVEDKNTARKYLRLLSGRTHKVFTAFNVKHNKVDNSGMEKTLVKMKYLTDFEIESYLELDEWQGNAGAYSIQESAGKFFPSIKGCFYNVIGLPLFRIDNILKGIGYNKKKSNG